MEDNYNIKVSQLSMVLTLHIMFEAKNILVITENYRWVDPVAGF